MDRDRVIRGALWAAACSNLVGAFLFLYPASAVGQLGGLPAEVPLVYRGLVCLFVLLFGGTYAWLASEACISRPLLALGAIGKASAFALVFLMWLAAELPARSVLLISADLAFAAIFAWWLVADAAVAAPQLARGEEVIR